MSTTPVPRTEGMICKNLTIYRQSYERLGLNVLLAGLPSLYEAFQSIRENNRLLKEGNIQNRQIVSLIQDQSTYFKIAGALSFAYLLGVALLLTGLFLHANGVAYAGGAVAGSTFLLGTGAARKAYNIFRDSIG